MRFRELLIKSNIDFSEEEYDYNIYLYKINKKIKNKFSIYGRLNQCIFIR